MHSPNPLQPRFKANPQLLVRDQGLAVLLLLVLVQLLQEYSWIGLTLVGLLLQHCPVVDVVILMVQRPEQYAVFGKEKVRISLPLDHRALH